MVIGAGIVGLAGAYKILESDPSLKICILEKENGIARHQSGHNSNVIHSGIYYKPGSLKATNCIRGYSMMVDFCQSNNIPYDLCGKMIVATSDKEEERLNNLYKRGKENGLDDIELLSGEELSKREPNITGIKAIYIPYTGITDFKLVCKALYDDIVKIGGKVFFGSKVMGIETGNVCTVKTSSGDYSAKYVVNCAGLYSDVIAKYFISDISIKILPFRGEYFWVKKREERKINSLVYPVPDPAFPFLGVHLTKTIDGRTEAGPNAVPAFRREGYKKSDINLKELWDFISYRGALKLFRKYYKTGLAEIHRSFSKNAFTESIKRFMPGISTADLSYGGAGVRAQACDRGGNIIDDFVIYETEYSINVCNAPSPAATSSLSIGKTISDKLMNKINR
ncbi:MAG: L-2-hydroxyglutarate oxidase [Ignavibacteriae bacterium]|nr:L-2-hydroxyglutarate oxidase [Ignavibacteriota bacterium]MCB9244020.1 L-2-hydroxyglutarate oxidase [Ignavibacteriales bacterium]